TEAFTQGLVYEEGLLLEGTGLHGKSSLRRVALETGAVIQQHDLEAAYFGEGIATVGDRIIQLTWRENRGFVYERASFALLGQFQYPGEGWGLTYDGNRLIMSDGTHVLRFLDPETFEETGSVRVRDKDRYITRLNELEYIKDEVFANVWQSDYIARIDPATGSVTGWINLTGLLASHTKQRPPDVLNGIAYDAAGDRLFVTGKNWPLLFEIRLVAARIATPNASTPN
ncbi:MAG TPA: glutaminyl-peptide cyclotransferase, partial [Candidatus Hydrogenedentes bacterium]|nr:glutaminyl-peptide cyclotransferase [Candidatus Hydrogenedentota bacterium]